MWNEGDRTFTAGEALVEGCRVKIEAGTSTVPPEVVYADAGEPAIGVTRRDAADGDTVAVRLINHTGTIEALAAGAISAGAIVYGADDGKVEASGVGVPVGICIEAATAADDIIEVMPLAGSLGEFYYSDPNPDLLSDDETAIGVIDYVTMASACSFGQVVYENASGEYALATASNVAKQAVAGMVLGSYAAAATGRILKRGVAKNTEWSGTINVGALVYLQSGGSNSITPTAPGSGVQILGRAVAAAIVEFEPSNWAVPS